MDIFQRSNNHLNLTIFPVVKNDVISIPINGVDVNAPNDQYILRMMIRSPETTGFVIPPELQWIKEFVTFTNNLQNNLFRYHPYVYVTVRCGVVKSVTDDEWHVDGFSMRTPHVPEQNYIWSDSNSTEYLEQRFHIPHDFDPMRHNIHTFFQDNADESKIKALPVNHISIIDPYVVHRRPVLPVGTVRKFFRISYVPIEIESDTCMQNPLLPVRKYNRLDIRSQLVKYQG